MSNLKNELLDASPYKKQQEEAKALVGKWEKSGLLDGLNEDFQKTGMATLLENQARQLISENSFTSPAGGGAVNGDEEWSGVALPLVRRIFGEIAAQEFVSVQPMNLPSGLVFYLDFKYGTAQGTQGFNGAAGNDFLTGAGRTSQTDSVFGVTDADRGTAATEGLYGAGRFGYSVNDVNKVLEAGDMNTGSYDPFTNVFTEQKTVLTGAQFDKFTNFNAEFSASATANSKHYQITYKERSEEHTLNSSQSVLFRSFS